MSEDIVERLRRAIVTEGAGDVTEIATALGDEAAAEIEALRERVREAEGRVAEAVAAERERCVKVAREYVPDEKEWSPHVRPHVPNVVLARRAIADLIERGE